MKRITERTPMTKAETRLKIEAELRRGKSVKELAEKYGANIATVSLWKRKLKSEQTDSDIDPLMEYDEVTLHGMVTDLEKVALPEARKAHELVKDVIGLQRLEEKTREVSFSILKSVQEYLSVQDEPSLKDLKEASIIVGTLHTALFSRNTTQVNVLNNNSISGDRRELFKSSLGA
jgi:transposase-like protein